MNKQINYLLVENAINNLVRQNQRPTLEKIKQQLQISDKKTLDELIDYYRYMWEQRHTVTYLENSELAKISELEGVELAKRALQLEESLAMMRATIEATEDCLLIINKEGKLIGVNKKLIDFVKLPQSALTSKDETEGLNYLFAQITDPQELTNLIMKKYQDPTPGYCGEMFFRDGRVVERYYQPQIINNVVVGHVWSLRDVTEKRKNEETLRLANRAMYASTHGILLIENKENFPITYFNPACITLLNIDEGRILQHAFLDGINGFLPHQNQFTKILTTNKSGSLTIQYPAHKKIIWLEIKIDPVYEKNQRHISHFVCVINDVSRNKELENILQHKTVHDALTGLPNKVYLEDAIRHRINAASQRGEKFGLLFIDIDRFKNINDTLGHRVGDILLRLFSKRIQNSLQKQDILARIGGDEFIVLIHHTVSEMALHNIAKRLLEESRKKFAHSYHEFNVTVSIGIALFPEAGADPDALMRNADIAMYQAKFSGRDRLCFYNQSLNNTISRRVKIENELRHAIENNEFELHYQPIYNIANKQFDKVEALLRWNNTKLGKIAPAEFIPIVEDIGMMHLVGEWVIQAVAHQRSLWQNTPFRDTTISLNISAKQLLDENFIRHIKKTLAVNQIIQKIWLLEITESFFLLQEKIPEKLLELKNMGVRIAIDDFGTGYSNLHYLHKLHISYLKIDKSFIDQIDQDCFNDSVLLTIIAIGKSMNFKIIAEGVETKSQYQFLKKSGCDEIQGYYFSKPLPIAQLETFLKKQGRGRKSLR